MRWMLLVLLVALPAHAQLESGLVIIGSSSACGPFGRVIGDELEESLGRPRRICHSSAGLARPDFFDWMEEVPRHDFTAAFVVVLLGGNDAQSLRLMPSRRWVRWRPEDAWRALYAQRAHDFVQALCEAGAARVVVVLPPTVVNARLEGRLPRVRESMATGVATTSCGVTVDPTTAVLDMRTSHLGDGVHLSTAGSRVAWEVIGPTVMSEFGVEDAGGEDCGREVPGADEAPGGEPGEPEDR